MMGFGRGGNGAGGNSSSSTSNLSASAPPFTVDRSNINPNSNPLSHYPESSYGTEPLRHTWKYTNSSSHKPELDMNSTRTTRFPISDAMSTSPSPTHWMACSHDAKTLGNSLAYGGGEKSYYPPSVPPMVDESSPLVEDGSAYTHTMIDQDYRPEWMHRSELNQFTNGRQSKRVELDGSFSSGKEKIWDLSAQIDYTHCAIDKDYMPQQMDSLDINGIQYRRVELDGSCSSCMENVGDMSSRFDYTQSAYDWEYRPRQMDSLNINGNLYKRAELDGNFSKRAEIGGSHIYTNPVTEGCGIKFGDKSGEIHGRSNGVTDRAAGILTADCVNNKLCFEKNPSSLVSGLTYPESYPLSLSHETDKNFYNYKNSCSPYDKRVRPNDSAFTSSISVTRSSPTVVIMPPPAVPDILGRRDDSREPAENDNVAGVCNVHFDRSNPSNNKDSGPKPSSEIKEGSLDPNFSKQCNDRGFLSTSVVNELSGSLHINDIYEGNFRERFGSQVSDSNFSHGLAMAECVEAVNSVEDSSDFIDHHNLAVDSPCWKGAPSSQFSEFDVESGISHNFIGNLNKENFGFDEAKHKDFRLLDDSTRAFPAKAGHNDEKNESVLVKNNVVLPLESILDVNQPSKEQILPDDAKAEKFMVSTSRSSKGVQTRNFDLNHFSSKDEVRMNLNDASESSGAVAFHVAEKVLASPSSQEDATELELQVDSKIKTTIKTMHYLSEILLSHLSYDACALEGEDILAMNHTISNLDACMSHKITRPRNKPEPSNPVRYISNLFGEYHDMGNVDYKHGNAQDDERAKSLIISFLRDDTDITRDDGLAKVGLAKAAIKKVLEENFHYNEEMDSQAILFKSLWLEAEATLCSISYKARFDRLKIEMEHAKPKSLKENKDVSTTMQKVHCSYVPSTSSKLTLKSPVDMIPKPTTQIGTSSVSITVQDDRNDSIMSRFNTLKSRENNLKSIDMKNGQQSKIIIGDQSQGEALKY